MNLTYSENDNSSKQVLVFVHAFPLNRQMWKHQVNALEDSIRVIAPDLPGFGDSPRLTVPPSMNAYAQTLLGFLDDRGIEKAVFGGCSMGGYILFELMRCAPQRVAGLLLCDTRAEADSPDMRQNRMKSIEEVRSIGTASLAEAMPPKLVSPNTYSKNPELVNELIKTILNNPKEGVADALQALADRPDSSETLKTIAVPTLILVGADDVLTPPDLSKSIQATIPHSHLAILPNAGHLSPLEQPEIANNAIRTFLVDSDLL